MPAGVRGRAPGPALGHLTGRDDLLSLAQEAGGRDCSGKGPRAFRLLLGLPGGGDVVGRRRPGCAGSVSLVTQWPQGKALANKGASSPSSWRAGVPCQVEPPTQGTTLLAWPAHRAAEG